jgi:tyrosine-protein kinase Etk/Wzc
MQEDGIDFLEILLILVRDRRRIVTVTLVALLIGVVVSVLLKPTFTATATILPPQQQQSSASAVMGQLSSLAGLGGGGGLLKNPADMYVSMLTSRTVLDRLIDRFRLQALYKTKTMDATRKELKANITTEAGAKDGLIQIAIKDTSPRRASDLTNGLIEDLYHLTSTLAITSSLL